MRVSHALQPNILRKCAYPPSTPAGYKHKNRSKKFSRTQTAEVRLGAAIDYLDAIGLEPIAAHEHELIEQTVGGLRAIPGIRLVGSPRERAGPQTEFPGAKPRKCRPIPDARKLR